VGRLPDWLIALPDAETMRAADRWAIEERGVPSLELMERAGTGVARALERLVPDGPVAVVCGKGNNGGDGLVVARLLRDAGREVTILCTASPDEFSGDARANLERLPGERPITLTAENSPSAERESRSGAGASSGPAGGPSLNASSQARLDRVEVVVDAVFGTGFQGAPHGAAAAAIDAVNAAEVPVLSVDVPSGVDASTGVISGAAVRASLTVTFHAAKPGLWIRPGKAHAGQVEVLDIGIPRGAPGDLRAPADRRGTPAVAPGAVGAGTGATEAGAAPAIGLIDPSVLDLLPRRSAGSTKFLSGHVLLAGGSRGLTGAPRMAAHASMRAGAGYVTACVPVSLQAIIAGAGPVEMVSAGLADDDGSLTVDGVGSVLRASERGGALAVGPGLGRNEGAVAFARRLVREARLPLVLDADGLNAHAGRLAELAGRTAPTVLTPHAGELGRLLELDSSEIERERLRHACAAAVRARAVVVLKGDDTLVADPCGRVAVSPGGSPALATAGTGDVLTGVIAALLAQGLDAFTAAAAGVCLHAAAGREAACRQGAAEGVIASDVIAALPAVRARAASAGADDPEREGGR
jgi:ADP-dependent NAD(P)H-hydrate dehydratase / NAD(P)H-hydrate epimerase